MRKLPTFILLSLFFFLFVPRVFASDVVLNEFFPNPPGSSESDAEWIELYNSTSSSIDISGWKLDDDPSSAQAEYVIPSGTSVGPAGFLVFESSITGIQLSNSGDSVRLLGTDGTEVDTYTYDSSVAEDVSIGRSVNGGGSWTSCATPTKGSSNNCPLPTPTATSTPSPTPSPTQAPTPTKTPTPAGIPTPIPTSTTQTLTKTPTPTKKATPTPTSQPSALGETTQSAEVLSAVDELQESTPAGSLTQSLMIAFLFIGLGLALLAFLFIWKKRKIIVPEEK